ncbi:MAG: hypothetical protein FH749_07590 [Firmicutes bacterium]|nr:hypothetical protein [Bacillota bacterium]
MVKGLTLAICILLCVSGPALATPDYEVEEGRWFTLYDQEHNVLLRTGIRIHVGDRFLAADNTMYEVYRVDYSRLRAWAQPTANQPSLAIPSQQAEEQGLPGTEHNHIAVYHTHSGESYIPSDGLASTDQQPGGIYAVGREFSLQLEDNSIEVTHSQETHFPYSGSYRRSRVTAQNLIEQGVDAIFDVHRDAAPWGEYYEEIDGMQITQVLLVVGTQNPAYRVNEEFAWQLKAVSDSQWPDLVKGVFYARGDYNQDLHSRALLLEIGAYNNNREHAEAGARKFADIVDITLYGEPEVAPLQMENGGGNGGVEQDPRLQSTTDPSGATRGGVLKGLFTLLGLVGFGGTAYMFISLGSWQGVRDKLVDFWHNEFRDLTARIPWEKARTSYLLKQLQAIRLAPPEVPEKVRDWWDKIRRRDKV